MDLDSFIRIYMLRSKESSRLVSSDGEDTQIKASKDFTNFFKYVTISSISWIKNFFLCGRLNHKSSP